MKRITLYKDRIPLMAEAINGINRGEIQVSDEEQFICDMMDEFETDVFEAIKLKKLCLEINKKMSISKITVKERQ